MEILVADGEDDDGAGMITRRQLIGRLFGFAALAACYGVRPQWVEEEENELRYFYRDGKGGFEEEPARAGEFDEGSGELVWCPPGNSGILLELERKDEHDAIIANVVVSDVVYLSGRG